jgi:putative transposase
MMCRLYGVTRAGFYAWRSRERSERERHNESLAAAIRSVRRRRPKRGLVFHTDRGTEYAGTAFKRRLAELGITQSMNRPGKMTDNAFIESFFHSMKSEIYHGVRFEEDLAIREALKRYVPFYNTDRLHSSLHYVSPATSEQQARGAGCQ